MKNVLIPFCVTIGNYLKNYFNINWKGWVCIFVPGIVVFPIFSAYISNTGGLHIFYNNLYIYIKKKKKINFFKIEDFADFIRTTIGICGVMVILSVTIFAILVNVYLNVIYL